MDRQIKKAKKVIDKKMEALVKEDKKRDPACHAGEKMMKAKKK